MKTLVSCYLCSKEFLKENCRISTSKHHYCSQKCSCKASSITRWSRHKKPSKYCQNCNVSINDRNINNHCQKCYRDLGLNKFSENTKKLLSEKRKQFLRDNPDKHPWKSKDKFKSEPCENFKKILRENNYTFLEEFTPTSEHSYSIDIVFPEKMIGVEINGNQHYERDGKLKKYYQDRHDDIESSGWKLYEIHYSLCFNQEYILNLINQISAAENKIEFNYEGYVKNKLEKNKKNCAVCDIEFHHYQNIKCKNCIKDRKKISIQKEKPQRIEKKIIDPVYSFCQCGQQKTKNAKLCMPCMRFKRRKVARPSKSELHELVWSVSAVQLSKKLGVSDVAIAKWCKHYQITKPDRGYWAKFEAKQILDYQV